jgi:DNA-binding NarL/FixJ family response regulator
VTTRAAPSFLSDQLVDGGRLVELGTLRVEPPTRSTSAACAVVVLADDRLCEDLRAALERSAVLDAPPAPPRLSAVPPAASGSPIDRLTSREREVLCLLAEGLSTGEIAERLFVSLPTVKCHVARVLHKLHARDRVQAVVAAFRSGLAPRI